MNGDYKFTDNSQEILNAKEMAIEKALEMIGIKAESFAKKDCPVDTGRLRNSITYATEKSQGKGKSPAKPEDYEKLATPEETAVYIGTNVEYAESVEYGDNIKHTTGKAHFLRDAVTNHSDLYKQIAEKALKGSTS